MIEIKELPQSVQKHIWSSEEVFFVPLTVAFKDSLSTPVRIWENKINSLGKAKILVP